MLKRYSLLIGLIMVDMLVIELRQNDVAMHEPTPEAKIWGELYQTESNPNKMYDFDYVNKPGRASEHKGIREAIETIMPAFKVDLDTNWMSLEGFKDLLYKTARHESYNRINPNNPFTSQKGDGPAKSWWQVEPSTARDIVTARLEDGSVAPSKRAWGDRMEHLTGISADSLFNMTDDELGSLLEESPVVGAAFAASKYLQAKKAKKK